MDELSPSQELFIDVYTDIGSETYMKATKSALVAGYAEASAHAQASRMLKKDKIRNAIGEKVKEKLIEAGISKQSILLEMANKAYNMNGMTSEAGQIKCLEMLAKYINLFEQSEQNSAPKILIQYASQNKQERID